MGRTRHRGRDRPIEASRDGHCAAVQLPRTGYSGLPQHLLLLRVCDADLAGYSRILPVASRMSRMVSAG